MIAHERDAKVKRLAGKIDRVLVDAPCTGFGTLRRNPDLKWRQTPRDLAELAAKQARILAAASALVKPGGRLVYATCSVLPEENDAIVDAFLGAHDAFTERDTASLLAQASVPLDTGRATAAAAACAWLRWIFRGGAGAEDMSRHWVNLGSEHRRLIGVGDVLAARLRYDHSECLPANTSPTPINLSLTPINPDPLHR